MLLSPEFCHSWQRGDHRDVFVLGTPHRTSSLRNGDLYASSPKDLHKDLRRCATAIVDGRASPVEQDGFRCASIHDVQLSINLWKMCSSLSKRS